MRIVIYGECEQYGSGAWCYYDTLMKMGHDVSYFSRYNGLEIYDSNIMLKVIRKVKNGGALEFHRLNHINLFKKFIEKQDPDIVIILKGLLIDKKTITELKKRSWVVMINHDDFFSRYKSSRSNIQFNAIPSYDYIFPTKQVNVGEIKAYNRNIEFFPFAYHTEIHKPPEYNNSDKNEWASDVVFIGSWYKERMKQLEFLVSNLKWPVNLKIYGSHWNKISDQSVLKPYIQNRFLGPAEMSKAIFYAKICLGFLCKENRDDYTQRTFEIPATLGLLLAERTTRHSSFYQEGKEAEFFDADNYNELVSKVSLLLNDDLKINTIKEAGYHKLQISKHSYKDRLDRLISLYNQHQRNNVTISNNMNSTISD